MQQRPANAQLVKKLKRQKPKDLDRQTHALHHQSFDTIDCLACANCCKTTSPTFYQADIERLAKALKMKPAAFIDTYLHVDAEGDYVLNEAPCPFLAADNTCIVYEARPTACREYPHTNRKRFYQILPLTLKNTEICPAVQQVMEGLQKIYSQ